MDSGKFRRGKRALLAVTLGGVALIGAACAPEAPAEPTPPGNTPPWVGYCTLNPSQVVPLGSGTALFKQTAPLVPDAFGTTRLSTETQWSDYSVVDPDGDALSVAVVVPPPFGEATVELTTNSIIMVSYTATPVEFVPAGSQQWMEVHFTIRVTDARGASTDVMLRVPYAWGSTWSYC